MTKQQIISARILKLVAEGHDIRAAMDAVLGAGSFEKLAGDLWEAFRGNS